MLTCGPVAPCPDSPAVTRPLLVVAALLAPVLSLAQDVGDGRRCGTPAPTPAELSASAQIVAAQRVSLRDRLALRIEAEPITVPVAFHVVTGGPGGGQGNVPDERIAAQIDTLNSAFAAMGIRFVLSALQRVENDEWYDGLRLDSEAEARMKRALALDPSLFLNLYTANLGLDYLGWATVAVPGAEADRLGGVVLLDQTLPGGSEAPYNLGHTGTHEVGHWVGLNHTFLGGCAEPNDGVADTPQERSGATGCPITRDSCPLDPGPDPVTNYMDYSDDACMTTFTAGQAERALGIMRAYRPVIVAGDRALATLSTTAFDRAFVGVPVSAPIRVTNLTDAPFTVTDVISGDARFVAAPGVTVPPGEVGLLDVTFTADAPGEVAATLTLQTDRPEVGILTVEAGAVATLPPTARLGAPAIGGRVLVGEALDRTVEIANAGGGELTFTLASAPSWVASVDPEAGVLGTDEATALTVTFEVEEEAHPEGCTAPAAGALSTVCTANLVFATNDPLRPEITVEATITLLPRPTQLVVGPVYPNPSAGRITVPLAVPDGVETLTVEVFDARGRLVATLAEAAPVGVGYRDLAWEAGTAPAGVYVVRARSATEAAVARLVVAR